MQGAGFWGWALGYVPARRLEPGASEGHTPAREPPRQACVLNLASTNNLSSQPLSDPSHSRLPFLLGGVTHGSDEMDTRSPVPPISPKGQTQMCVYTMCQPCSAQPPFCARRGKGLEAGLPL